MGICVSCRRRERKAPEILEKQAGLGAGGTKGPAAALLPRDPRPLRPLRPLPIMANSISNIKMHNPIKNMVSKRRKRYIQDGFNLDLACILFECEVLPCLGPERKIDVGTRGPRVSTQVCGRCRGLPLGSARAHAAHQPWNYCDNLARSSFYFCQGHSIHNL